MVFQDFERKIFYWDSPGLNQTITITQAQYLKAFYSIDIMFIVTAITFKNSIRTIQVMDTINPPNLYLVRNQCDKFENEQDLQEAMEKDKKVLKDIKNVKSVLYVSTVKGDEFKDNAKLRNYMKGV